jgi:hypothetical protein
MVSARVKDRAGKSTLLKCGKSNADRLVAKYRLRLGGII